MSLFVKKCVLVELEHIVTLHFEVFFLTRNSVCTSTGWLQTFPIMGIILLNVPRLVDNELPELKKNHSMIFYQSTLIIIEERQILFVFILTLLSKQQTSYIIGHIYFHINQ
jgi:hypothetical protein